MIQKIIFIAATFFLLVCSTFSVQAQRHHNTKTRNSSYNFFKRADKLTFLTGAGLSVMNSDNIARGYRSDIGLMKGNGYGPTVSLGAMYQLSPFFGVLGTAEYVGFKGSQDEARYVPEHSFTFESDVFSASGAVVMNLANRNMLSRLYSPRFRGAVVVPYLKAGFGLMRFSASSFAEGHGGELAPGIDYPAIATFIPVGGGLRIRYSDQISFAPEVTINMTSTDYLDNTYEVTGWTGKNDNFVSATVKVLYTPSFNRRFVF
ncbi:hypothetical protein [Pontibacter pamirensis]|uniref:hypothetical protein n=1 Tax=Pontibacter pamirensis TaxID=2562824 RepID=UPI0013896D02|nr:hypothetical protein [Pontibacter pamirensis]